MSHSGYRPRWRATAISAAGAVVAVTAVSLGATSAHALTGPPGADAFWNEPHVQGFADAVQAPSKVWYTLGDGQLENVFYPQTDTPDTFGLQYYVTDGSSFTDDEVSNTSHAISLVDPTSLEWKQTNTAANGEYTITKTYVADPSRSVVLVQTVFDNLTSTPLSLYAQYDPALNNDGMGNTGASDSGGDLVASNGSVSSALASSIGISQSSSGYAGTSGDGASELSSSHAITTPGQTASSAGHITQTGKIPVAASGSTTFTLALAFDSSQSAAVSDASASLSGGFSAAESSFQSGWHNWNAGLVSPPASVTGNSKLTAQYRVSLMELKADEDKNYVGAFIAAPTVPWGASVSADSAGAHGYHLVWTRDEYQMATALLAAGDKTDASDALNYIFNYEETSSGYVKQNSWLNGNQVWNGTQEDEVAFPIILAYQLGKTDSATWSRVQSLANYIVANGPYTGEERWEENGGYSPSTIAAEVAGLVCAANIATANGASSQASTYLSKADAIYGAIDANTYTTSGSLAGGSYYVRITPNGNPNNGDTISISNGGGTWDERAIVDQGFLELSRLGVKSPTSPQITNSLAAVDAAIKTTLSGEGTYWGRYNHDGYGETSSGADYTGAGVGRPWPVLSGERGEYDVQSGDSAGAQSMLSAMANAANAGYQISEQIWPSASADGFTQGQPDNSSTPLMWAMAQYVRLALDISAGKTVETPAIVAQRYADASNVSVTFDENATTYWGQNVFVVGSIPQLGSWNTNAAIPLSSATYPVWSATVTLPGSTYFEYKYIKKNPDGSITWESDPNRNYTTGPSGSVTLNDSWR